jgi:ElaA protein
MVYAAATREIDVVTLYELLRLRSAVFVEEQACTYLDLDGRDLEPGCLQLWCTDDAGAVVATARLLREEGRHRIGRVCTAAARRRHGLATALVLAALDRVGDGPIVLNAQTYLTGWYERFGFASTGHEFLDDGVPHTEMIRTAGPG